VLFKRTLSINSTLFRSDNLKDVFDFPRCEKDIKLLKYAANIECLAEVAHQKELSVIKDLTKDVELNFNDLYVRKSSEYINHYVFLHRGH
jgi:hypothetical protein